MSAVLAAAPDSVAATVEVCGDLVSDGFRISRWDGDATVRPTFDGRAVLLLLNLMGEGTLESGEGRAFGDSQIVVAVAGRGELALDLASGERHRFAALELRPAWIDRWLPASAHVLRAPVRAAMARTRPAAAQAEVFAMPPVVAQLASDLLQPPRGVGSVAAWRHGKALEAASLALIAEEEPELFCERTKRLGRDRVRRVQEILLADLEHPPALAELGRRVGCSPFYLSRTFRQETGATISAFIRQARLERAAELLRTGEANVTEAAMTVGYSSLSHFSKAFAEAYGCCPCLYGRKA